MARTPNHGEVLEEYEFKRAGSATKYPYEVWLDGKIRRLRRGQHFDGNTAIRSVVSSVSTAARNRGMRLRSTVEDPNTVVIQAYHEADED